MNVIIVGGHDIGAIMRRVVATDNTIVLIEPHHVQTEVEVYSGHPLANIGVNPYPVEIPIKGQKAPSYHQFIKKDSRKNFR